MGINSGVKQLSLDTESNGTYSDNHSNLDLGTNSRSKPQMFALQSQMERSGPPPTMERSFMNDQSANESTFLYDPYDVPDTIAVLFTVRVLYDYQSCAREELSIFKDQLIPVTATHEDGWWEGIVVEKGRRRKGLFPSNFTEHI
jgi:hypothetical protein